MKAIKIQLVALLSLIVLFPSGSSLIHDLAHHHEHSCFSHGPEGHYHAQDYDCQFLLFFHPNSFFQKNSTFELSVFPNFQPQFQKYVVIHPKKIGFSYSLRGPPTLS